MNFSVKILKIPMLCAGLLFATTGTAATMTLVDTPGGVSGFAAGQPNSSGSGTTTPIIYAGMVTTNGAFSGGCAPGASPPPSSTATCNSCDGSGLKPCNPVSIHPGLYLTVTLKTDTQTVFNGNPQVRFMIGQSGMLAPSSVSPVSPSAGVPFTVSILWSSICTAANNASCASDMSGTTLSIGIDNNGDTTFEEKVDFTLEFRPIDTTAVTVDNYTPCPDGVAPAIATQGTCDFGVLPGDQKIYMHYFAASDNNLTTPHASIKYANLVLFYEKTFAAINNKSPSFVLALKNNTPDIPSLASRKITGLTNDETYCLALGNQDQAGNITYFTPASELDQSKQASVKKYCATPSEVVGLLDDKHCFIATATYGSQMAPEVVTFREFRNKFLLTNDLGRSFVKAYYKFGPVLAQWVSESPYLKAASLTALWPLLIFAKLSLVVGFFPALFMAIATFVLLQQLFKFWWQRRLKTGEL